MTRPKRSTPGDPPRRILIVDDHPLTRRGMAQLIGQQPDLSFLKPADGVALTPGGTIRVDPETLATSAPGLFAGGDVAFWPRNLIEAVANGKRAARSIHEYLSPHDARLETRLDIETLMTPRYRMAAGFERFDREAPPTLDVGRRTGITEVEISSTQPSVWARSSVSIRRPIPTTFPLNPAALMFPNIFIMSV